MPDINEMFSGIEILNQASPKSAAALCSVAQIKKVKKGGHLFWERDEMDLFYFSFKGLFSLYKLNGLGEKKVIFLYGPGHMLNEVLLQELPASVYCEALLDSAALSFPKQAFTDVMSGDFRLTQAVMNSMAHKIRRLYRQLKNTTGSIRGDKKIAAKLWKLSKDHGTACDLGICIDLELSITYLADMLGSKRETVSRQMKLLLDEGVVLQKNKQFIIPDRDKLMDYFKHA